MTYFPKPTGDTIVARYAYPGVGAFDPKLGQKPEPSKLETGITEGLKWFLAPFRPQAPAPTVTAAQPTFFQKYRTPILIGGGVVAVVGVASLLRKRRK